MYGAKLAVFCKKLEKILPTDIKGYGPIKITDEGKPVGLWSLEGRKLNECQRVKEILSRVTHYIEGRAYSVLEDINLTIDKIFDSDTYKFSRLEENYRIVPVFLTSNNLRIFSKIDNRDMQIVYDEFKTINYDFEKTLKDKENDKEKAKRNKDFGMVYAAPKIGGKYSIIANLFFIMNYELKIITRKTDLTKGDESEYNVLVSGLADGLAKHYNLDPDDEDFMDNLREECKEQGKPVPIDILEMEKFFCILEGINLKLDILSDIANLRNENLNALNQLNKEKYELMKTSSVSALDPLKLKQTQLEDFKEMYSRQEIKLKQDIKHLVSFLHKLNLTPSTEEKLALKGTKIKIEKERYFKPVVNEIVDDNLYREKYKKNLTNYRELDPKLLEMEFFKNAQNDEVSRHWLKPKDLYVYDAKEAESNKVDDLFVDPFLIPNEEREKELMRKQLSTQTYFKKINK